MHRHGFAFILCLVACRGGERRDATATGAPGADRASTAPTPTALTADASPQGTPMPPTDIREPLPTPFDVRVTRALELPLAADVVVAFAHVAMAKSPATNYRFELHRDGRLFYTQRSAKAGDWQQPFDQPLPAAPSTTVAEADVAALLQTLEAGGFFDHPGYQANPQVEDGSFWIVRARRGADVHAVVFQNTQPDWLPRLTALSDPLWTQGR